MVRKLFILIVICFASQANAVDPKSVAQLDSINGKWVLQADSCEAAISITINIKQDQVVFTNLDHSQKFTFLIAGLGNGRLTSPENEVITLSEALVENPNFMLAYFYNSKKLDLYIENNSSLSKWLKPNEHHLKKC